ncbi:hypothetical protein V8F20_009132 [Naviculisporaceae sp. PSN 640]
MDVRGGSFGRDRSSGYSAVSSFFFLFSSYSYVYSQAQFCNNFCYLSSVLPFCFNFYSSLYSFLQNLSPS